MKTFPKKSLVVAALLGMAGVAALMPARAQETITSGPVTNPDSIVQITAESDGLSQVFPSNLSRGGTYWWVMPGGTAVPAPCLPQNVSVPIYQMASKQYLVDETGGVVPQPSGRQAMLGISSATLIQEEINLVLNLIGQVQTNEQMQAATATATAMSAGVQTADVQSDGGGFSPDYLQNGVPYLTIAPAGTNLLITVFNNTGPANYELWWTPVLVNYPWTAVAVGTTGQTNFTVGTAIYPAGFYRALQDTNAIPLWEAADPNNQAAGILAVFIDNPTNNAALQ
ncbi:MAG: hypothetical protein WBN75_19835 [Verrucomicrobiia bacterium]